MSKEPLRFRPRQAAEMRQSLESCKDYCIVAQKMLAYKIPLESCGLAQKKECEDSFSRLLDEKIKNDSNIIDGR